MLQSMGRSDDIEEFVKSKGFKNEEEMRELVASIDLSQNDALTTYSEWRINDGTKEGLLKLIEKCK